MVTYYYHNGLLAPSKSKTRFRSKEEGVWSRCANFGGEVEKHWDSVKSIAGVNRNMMY
jgi:hypothetical protein